MESEDKVSILLVDDRPDNLLTLEAVLSDLGQNLVKANSGRDALKALLKQDFAVILLDVQMPGMDGFETADLIKERERSRHTPIIFLTAISTSEVYASRGYSLGAVDYIAKPIVPEILRSKVEVFVELFKKTRQVQRLNEDLQRRAAELESANTQLQKDLDYRCEMEETTRRLMEEQARREAAEAAVKSRDEFLSVASHELKTPLTILLGFAELLQRRATRSQPYTLAERDYRLLQAITDHSRRLQKLIESLLDLSRMQADGLTIEPSAVDLGELTRRVVEDIQPMLDVHVMELNVAPEPLIVFGDTVRLEQVLQNLLQNAMKYSPQGGQIVVEAGRNDGYAFVSVSDEGIGIPEDAQRRVFERFFRASNTDERQVTGLGIGLYVVNEIVRRHKGVVELRSREGEGSTFTVRFPLHVPEAVAEV